MKPSENDKDTRPVAPPVIRSEPWSPWNEAGTTELLPVENFEKVLGIVYLVAMLICVGVIYFST